MENLLIILPSLIMPLIAICRYFYVRHQYIRITRMGVEMQGKYEEFKKDDNLYIAYKYSGSSADLLNVMDKLK